MTLKIPNDSENVFVDRSVELVRLDTALKEASSGKGQIVLIEGEAGVGKSALVKRFLSNITDDITVSTSECKVGERTPYASIREIMGISDREDISSIDIPLLGLMPIPTEKKPESLSSERDKMFDSFLSFLEKSSKKKPLLGVIDSAQWMDEASAKMLSKASPKIEKSNILLLVVYRPEDIQRGAVIFDTLKELKEQENVTSIKIQKLDYNSSREMIVKMLKRDDVPKNFIHRIYKETEGNPLFIKEIINSLIQEGILDPSSYRKIETESIRVPPTIKEVLMRRITKLDPEARKVLNYGAVIGPRFKFDVLRELTGMDEEKLLDIIDTLIDAKIIEEDPTTDEEIYIFTYMQIKEIVEESMNRSRKRVLHKKIAEYLEKINGDIYETAEHFFKGGIWKKAYQYALKAAEKSAASFGFESAVYYYNMALECSENIDNIEKNEILDILMKLGELYRSLGQWDEAIGTYSRAIEISEKLGEQRKIGEINLYLGSIEKNRGNWDSADICFEAANKIGKGLKDYHMMGDAERGLGYVHWRKGEYKDAVMHYTTAIRYAKETNDTGMAGKVFVEMGNLYSDMGNIQRAIEYYKKSIPRLKSIKSYDEIARVLNNLGDSYMQLEQWDKAIEYFSRCEDAAAKIGDVNIIAWSLFNGAEAFARKGDTTEAKKMCDEAYDVLERMDDRVGIASTYRVYGIISMNERKFDDAIKYLQKSVKILKDLNVKHLLALSEFELGNAFAGKGDDKLAQRWYNESLKIFEEINSKMNVEKVKKALYSET